MTEDPTTAPGAERRDAGRAAPDLAEIVARFVGALHVAGLPVGPDRAERFARAVTLAQPRTLAQLRACAHATLSIVHDDDAVLDRVFDAVFVGMIDPADRRGDHTAPAAAKANAGHSSPVPRARQVSARTPPTDGAPDAGHAADDNDSADVENPSIGSGLERLRHRDFGELSPEELLSLATTMAQLRLATPMRRSRRTRSTASGLRADLRATLRLAHRSGGEPLRLVRRRPRRRPRRLVVLCDISGSMAPYARAMLQLLYCAAGATRAEVFTFATRLTRLTPVLAGSPPGQALADAGASAPDWSGGTRIGAAVQEFLDRYGRRGMARGAVVLIISDGWETGDTATLSNAMQRLSRVAYRVVWANPRTQSPRYRPLVGGMAAAWPYCDAVVSAHHIAALDDLVAALADTVRTRRTDPAGRP